MTAEVAAAEKYSINPQDDKNKETNLIKNLKISA